MVELKRLTFFLNFHTFLHILHITYFSPNFEVEGEWIGVAVRITCHVFLFSQKAENENRKKLKRIGKSYIFKVESKYFVSDRSRPLRVQC